MILLERRKARAPLEEQKLYCPESHTAQRRPIRGLGNERKELRKRKTENIQDNEAKTKGAQESREGCDILLKYA